MHPVVARVTERIVQRSADTRGAYLAGVDAMIARKPAQDRMGCANLAHAYAALPSSDKFKVTVEKAPNIGIVTAYNDMLSAHQPYRATLPSCVTKPPSWAPQCKWRAVCLRCATA